MAMEEKRGEKGEKSRKHKRTSSRRRLQIDNALCHVTSESVHGEGSEHGKGEGGGEDVENDTATLSQQVGGGREGSGGTLSLSLCLCPSLMEGRERGGEEVCNGCVE